MRIITATIVNGRHRSPRSMPCPPIVCAGLGVVSVLLVNRRPRSLRPGSRTGIHPLSVIGPMLSGRSSVLAQRIGPHRPLTVGSALLTVGMASMAHIDEGDSY